MKPFRLISKLALLALCAWGIIFALGFAFTPRIDLEVHKPIGDELWARIAAFQTLNGHYSESEAVLLESEILFVADRKKFLLRHGSVPKKASLHKYLAAAHFV
jgi:hypothetical protein